MDTTTRASWETGVMPHLDDIPLPLVGKGEQNSVKIKLAIEAAEACHVFLIEEPENHLSHTNLGRLVGHLADRCKGRQLIVSTHSSFVLNKLGIDNILMFNGKTAVTLDHLPPDTKSYFQRLPGHDTLRMILADRSILVEGPSDELIVQTGYRQKHGRLPLEDAVEVISVGTSFKRFLDIAKLLDLDVSVLRDNDGDASGKKALFADYTSSPNIHIHIDDDNVARTLEPQLIKANGLAKMNAMLGTAFATEPELLAHCTAHKTECALALYEHPTTIGIPGYVQDAIR
ncbi:ATP-dependent nuclease [Labrys neptuniae]